MKIVVLGLWHLGSVTAACLSEIGHSVVGHDDSEEIVHSLQKGTSPIAEPGLNEMLSRNLSTGRLKFVSRVDSDTNYDALWVTIDTPVDENDRGQVESVFDRICRAILSAPRDCKVVISSQLPVGTIKNIQLAVQKHLIEKKIVLCYSPENLRLGSAIKIFMSPDRIIVGIDNDGDRKLFEPLFASITKRIEWMSIASAEMTKHAINAFLAISVVFANEIATLAEFEGANAIDIARGLRSDSRIGAKAYVLPGDSFAGGTLARDVRYLEDKGRVYSQVIPLLSSIIPSNDAHANWAKEKIKKLVGDVSEKTFTICGLAYKAGTNTLRRSSSVSLGDWLLTQGAIVQVVDNEDVYLPSNWDHRVSRHVSIHDVLGKTDVLVISSGYVVPEVDISFESMLPSERTVLVLDASKRMPYFEQLEGVEYIFVGKERKQND